KSLFKCTRQMVAVCSITLIHATKHIHQAFGQGAAATFLTLAAPSHDAHLLHQFLHFAELLHKFVDILHSSSAACSDPAAAAAIEQVGVAPLFASHAADDRLGALHAALGILHVNLFSHLADAWNHAQDV